MENWKIKENSMYQLGTLGNIDLGWTNEIELGNLKSYCQIFAPSESEVIEISKQIVSIPEMIKTLNGTKRKLQGIIIANSNDPNCVTTKLVQHVYEFMESEMKKFV